MASHWRTCYTGLMASLTTEVPFSIVSKSVDVDRQRIGVSGELDLVTAPLLLDAATAALALPGCRDLVIDLGGVTFMDASAIGTLVRIRRACEHVGGRLSVFGAEGIVAEVLAMTGFVEWVGRRRLRAP
jgi:anti-sigma B factor antagonist